MFVNIQNAFVKTFILDYEYNGYLPEVKNKIVEMAINGSGIRDTARVLEISPTTVINELKKESCLESVNRAVLNCLNTHEIIVGIQKVEDTEAELDEMWSYVQSKEHQRWLWHAIDHNTGKILAYTLGGHKDEVFLKTQGASRTFRDYPILHG